MSAPFATASALTDPIAAAARLAGRRGRVLLHSGRDDDRCGRWSFVACEPAHTVEARGRADGHLYLSGVVGDPTQKRGGGRFEIVDGHIYRLPLVLAILHVLNLSIPDADVFDDARADFFITGNRVQLEDIVLRDSALALVGTGSLTLPDRGLDLDLVNVGVHRWARVPLLTDFVEGASREFVELHVTGPLSRPTVRARPLRAFGEEFKRLFRKKKPTRTQAAPS